ncbi:SGNH/GDSL hydrolase family protein [Gordonia rhizosphera]|uniref:SGNH hydrolase-type esterase domain-containing protein n=1 Tax=Gordonia rhizosphera NBRC 16068 TaxID=1108045 RepID=K6W862_9ACTN|nr:SGNH/GDSL hydrolase family protein [Gordonia rhizosphera]GAB89931.1 hypothetical protein GORHZ_076_00070 [Gordonia rhizosphera NBRC 16068]
MRAVAVVVSALVLVLGGCASTVDDAVTPGTSSSVASSSAAAGEPLLVNLGDSYSAAAGVPPLVADSPVMCFRSSRNFAHLVAAGEGYRLDDVSCSGADTADFFAAQYQGVPPQLDAVSGDAGVVTLMIGGNDSDIYTNAIRTCAELAAGDPTGAPCRDRHGTEFTDTVDSTTFPALVRAFTAVRAKAPGSEIVAVGYPWILPSDTGCYPTVPVSTGDVPYLRDLQAALNDAIAKAAAQTDITFVDMSEISEGHDACAPAGQRWIEPQVGAVGASPLHPNEAGQEAIADQVQGALG